MKGGAMKGKVFMYAVTAEDDKHGGRGVIFIYFHII